MLDAWIIEELKKQERQIQEESQQPLQLPLPEPLLEPMPEEDTEPKEIVINL